MYRNMGVTLQVCGSDQWGNCIAGVELIRRIAGGEANIYSAPLIVNKATGVKFGKSETGAVWLDPAKTSPSDFYQFWINVDDDGVGEYLKVFTELDPDSIAEIMTEFEKNRAGRLAQKTLAFEVTKLVHGEAAATEAQQAAQNLQAGNASTQPTVKVSANAAVVDTLIEAKLASSKTEARQLLASGGVYINDEQTTKQTLETSDFQNGVLKLRRGKTLSNTVLVSLQQ